MYRSDIYISLTKDIASRLRTLNLIANDDEYNDIIDNADNNNFFGIFSSVQNKDIFSKIADVISNWDRTESSINTGSNIYFFNVPPNNQHYFKKIGVYDDNSNYVCVTFEYLAALKNTLAPQDMGVIERIWTVISGNTANKDSFWDAIRNGGADRYLLITDLTPANDDEGWRLYSYGYLLYCNTNKFSKPVELAFAPETPYKIPMSLINTAKYEQFFEVYDLINESHYCDDILSRYLKMYHIIENMCYRRHLAKISRGDIKRNAFVRKALGQFGNGSKSENVEITEGIVKLFPNLNSLLTVADFTADNISFLQSEYNIVVGANVSSNQIAKIIYQLRNSIAHNKATELHFAYANIIDYVMIIDLIKKIIERLEPAIIDLIGNNPSPGNPHPLEYQDRTFEVY